MLHNSSLAFPGPTLDLVLCALPDLTDCWVYAGSEASSQVKQTLRWLAGLSRVNRQWNALMKTKLFNIYFRAFNGRKKKAVNYLGLGSLDCYCLRAFINLAALNLAQFIAFVDAFALRGKLALQPADVADAMHEGDYHYIWGFANNQSELWALCAADLHALFGRLLDFDSALPDLVKHAASISADYICINSWALMLAAAYDKFPDDVEAEYADAKEKHSTYCYVTGECDYSGLDSKRHDLFLFARDCLTDL